MGTQILLSSAKMLRYYTIALIALSLSVFLMPIVNEIKTSTKIPIYMDGALFWIAFISTVRMAVKISRSRRRSPSFNEQYGELKKLGLIHFFQNKEAVIMDAMMFVSLIAFIVARFLRWSTTVRFPFCFHVFVFVRDALHVEWNQLHLYKTQNKC